MRSIIQTFGSLSGSKFNFGNSIILPVGERGRTVVTDGFPFTWSASAFVYLGIHTTPNVKSILKKNID